jgi:hypothetical protein
MADYEHFCSCKDISCKLNPINHNLGCDPCIKKNLKAGEIPSCFFHLVNDDLSQLQEFTVESFVKFYRENKKDAVEL